MTWLNALLETGYQFGSPGVEWAVYAGAHAALLAVAVLALNLLARRWLTAGQMCLLWGLVLARLLLPAAPASSFSLMNWFDDTSNYLVLNEPKKSYTIEEWMQRPRADTVASVRFDDAGTPIYEEAHYSSGAPAVRAPQMETDGSVTELVFALAPLLWFFAAVVIVAWTTLVNFRFSRCVKRSPVCTNQRLLALWATARELAGVRKTIPIVIFDGVRQPSLMGAIRPRLLLPTDVAQLADDQLRMIMLHELAHVRRFDVAINWILLVIRAAQWWNPVYWLAASRFCSLREQACDAFVIRRLQGQPSRNYGELLLTLAQRSRGPLRWRVALPASMLSFISAAFRRRAIGNRLRALHGATALHTRWHWLAVAALVALLGYCGLTDAQSTNSAVAAAPRKLALPLRIIETDAIGTLAPPASGARVSPHPIPTPPPAPEVRAVAAEMREGADAIDVRCRFVAQRPGATMPGNIGWRYIAPYAPEADEPLPGKADKVDGRPTARVEEYIPVLYAILDEAAAKSFLAEARAGRTNFTQSPRVRCRSGEVAWIEDSSQRPFVVAVREVAPGVMEPRISVATEGTKIRVRPVLSEDRKQVQLNARLEFTTLGAVQEAQVTPSKVTDEPVTIQVPRVKRCVIDLGLEVPAGQSLVIGSLPDDGSNGNLYLLLTPSVVKEATVVVE